MSKKLLLAAMITSTLSGCQLMSDVEPAPEGVCRSNARINIPQGDVAVKTSQGKKAIVLPVDVASGIDHSKAVANAFQRRLESQVDVSGAKLVDRSLAGKMKQEIELAEQSGRYNTSGVAIADYAVLAEVTSSTLSYSFSDEETKVNDEGERKYYPASCKFTGKVEGLVKVVALPSMEVLKRIEIAGKESSSFDQDRPDSDCPISQRQYKRLIEEAAKNAVNRNDDLKNQLAPSGVVEELRQCEEFGAMVRVNMGSNQGIRPETEMHISSPEQVETPDGKVEVEMYPVAKGTTTEDEVRNGIKPTYSWMSVAPEKVELIQRGDLVEARFDSGCNDLPQIMQEGCWNLYESFGGDKS
ncbi:hypothetical protein MD588_24245 [Photobacterium sp. SDRW27]|uniref:hypothetical protein n=1 Tax=Photobacterium obscurum TaxID=2829490 RepID=UPI002243471A|nr:hypothetical protein [Photobacterium obscurum]MCW8331913.1 hypothetical protein [Photobacterium obscurum]